MNIPMNSKVGLFLRFAVNFLLGLFFIVVGIAGLILPWSSTLQNALIELISYESSLLAILGFAFLCIGIALLAYVSMQKRGNRIFLRLKPHPIEVDQNLIVGALDVYWKEVLQGQSVFTQVIPGKKSLLIKAEMPPMNELQQEELLKKIQPELENLLHETIGIPHDIKVELHFRSVHKSD